MIFINNPPAPKRRGIARLLIFPLHIDHEHEHSLIVVQVMLFSQVANINELQTLKGHPQLCLAVLTVRVLRNYCSRSKQEESHLLQRLVLHRSLQSQRVLPHPAFDVQSIRQLLTFRVQEREKDQNFQTQHKQHCFHGFQPLSMLSLNYYIINKLYHQ